MNLCLFPGELSAQDDIGKWMILHAYRGSVAHGMYVPNTDPNSIDDIDTMGVVVPPPEYFLGLSEYGSRGTREIKHDPWDIVLYDVRKVVRLLAQGNPNVLSLLWVPMSRYLSITDAGLLLRDNRELFVGKHVYQPFVGYARAQLEKMERGAFNGYMGDRRKALVEKYGYDPKNAAHLIRLLRMGTEFLRYGTLYVDRTDIDADELLSIKRGEWTLEAIKAEAERGFQTARSAFEHSGLPGGPDRDKINRLCVSVVNGAWQEQS